MKLVEQLVDYLRSRGALPPAELARLAGKGYIAAPEGEEVPPTRLWAEEHEWDDWGAAPPRRRGRRRKGRPAGQELAPEELSARLAERFGDWEADLEGLVAVQSRLGPCAGWREAADGLCKRPQGELAEALASALRGGALSAGLLWGALHFEGHRAGLDGLVGEAGNAYRALLAGRPVSELTRYAWLLRHDEPAAVYRLVRAQKALTGALRALYRSAPETVRRSLSGTRYPHLLAVLEAARWARGGRGRLDGSSCRYYVLLPHEESWWQAWSLALQVDEAGASALLERCEADPFVPVPPAQVPGELWRFTVGEEEWLGRCGGGPLEAALARVLRPEGVAPEMALWSALRHPYPLVRWQAVAEAEKDHRALLVAALDDPEWDVRLRVARGVAASSDPGLLDALARALPILAAGVSRPEDRGQVLALLAGLRSVGAPGVAAVVGWASDPEGDLRQRLAEALGQAAVGPELAVPTLAGLLGDPVDAVFTAAVQALPRFGKAADQAVPELLRVLNGGSTWRRYYAAQALGLIGARAAEVVPALVQAVEASVAAVRPEALLALGRFGAEAAPALPTILRGLEDASGMIRRSAVGALSSLGDLAEAAVPALGGLIARNDGWGRAEALDLLAKLSPLARLPIVPELIRDGCSRSLEFVGPFATQGQAAVRAALESLTAAPQPEARREAAARARSVAQASCAVLPSLVDLAIEAGPDGPRQKALEVLGEVGLVADEVVAGLVLALEDADDEVQAAAADTLAALGAATRGLLPRLLQGLRSPSLEARSAARDLLRWLAPLAAAAGPALESSSYAARKVAPDEATK
jgi:HEAT repeat protein